MSTTLMSKFTPEDAANMADLALEWIIAFEQLVEEGRLGEVARVLAGAKRNAECLSIAVQTTIERLDESRDMLRDLIELVCDCEREVVSVPVLAAEARLIGKLYL